MKQASESKTPRPAPVAIIGMGCLFPQANHVGAFWANIKHGADAVTAIPETHWRPEDYFDADPAKPDHTYGKRGSFLSPIPFDPMAYGIPPNALEATDTSQLLGMAAAKHALEDAGYGQDREFDRERVSVLLGVTSALELLIPLGARLGHPKWRQALRGAGADEALIEDALARMGDAYVPWQENSFPGLLGNVVAGRISKFLDLGGTNCVCDAACASSLSALHLAAMELESGRADIAVTGGIDTFNDIFMYMCFSKTPALSPTGDARPFDANADGTILGEGLGVMVLKRLDDAERDGDKVYAVIRGVGASSDGKGDAIYAPNPAGQMKALRRAYEAAGVTPDTIELIEAHGTGTKAGDAAEAKSLKGVFGTSKDGPWCALGSVKSQIGHTKACAGAAGMMKAALALHHKVLPPTIKVTKPAEVLTESGSPFYVNTVMRPWLPKAAHPRRAGVSAFGFGGSNFHCLLEEHTPAKSAPDWDGSIEILALSADAREELSKALDALPDGADWESWSDAAAASRARFRGGAPHRLVLVTQRGEGDIPGLLAKARSQLDAGGASWQLPQGAYYASGPAEGKAAIVFPGQGAQYVGMLREIVCQFPEALAALAEAEAAAPEARVSAQVYPPPGFDAAAKKAQEAALRATDVAQPALGAVSVAALRVLQRFGITADAAAGHSYGELCALHAAGRLTAAELFRLSRTRGALMASGGGAGESGMLAVRAALEDVEAVLAAEKLDLVIANKNAPEQAVLSGGLAEIERARAAFQARKIKCVPLEVAAAFHSKWVASAEAPFHEAMAGVSFAPGAMAVYANTTAEAYPEDPQEARALLAGQLANPVEFTREIENMYAAGVRVFLEAGPGARMTGLIKAILGERAHTAIAVDASAGKKSGIRDLALALAQWAAAGRGIDLTPWNAGLFPDRVARDARKARMTVPLCGANYVAPRKPRPATPPRVSTPAPRQAAAPSPSQMPAAQAASVDPRAMSAALRASQENMAALQQLQAQTAALHQQFLESQQQSVVAVQRLLEQQQAMFLGGVAPAPLPAAAAPLVASPAAARIAAPPVQAEPEPTPAADTSGTERVLLECIAEKTGYPVEMLELDMALDADLGIDSIKRVEILSALQEKLPNAPAVEPKHLGEFQTLRQIAAFLGADAGPAPVPSAAASGQTETVLLECIAEKTGYPVEMLELDMALDADLGIDSIKRVEILSALQEKLPNAPAVEPKHLGEFQTLRQIVAFLGASAPPVPAPPAAPGGDVERVLLETVSEKTGYPAEMLELDMMLDADLGIDSIKRVEIFSTLQEKLPALPAMGPQELGALQSLRQVAEHLTRSNGKHCAAPAPAPTAANKPATEPALQRLVLRAAPYTKPGTPLALSQDAPILLAGDVEFGGTIAKALSGRGQNAEAVPLPLSESQTARLAGLVLLAPEGTDDAFLADAFDAVQQCGETLRQVKGLFATVSRMDGAFGLRDGDKAADVSGGLAGLAKTAGHEWPDVVCRAFDVARWGGAAEALAEALLESGPGELGMAEAGRSVPVLVAEALPHAAKTPFAPGEAVVVSGGARGVTAAVAIALAGTCQAALVLLGRSPMPDEEPGWLAALDGEAAIRRGLLEHAAEKLSPKELQAACAKVLAAREIRSTLAAIEAAGGHAAYYPADARDGAAIAAALGDARARFGPIRGLIHGAGVLADRLIADKTRDQFETVYGTKVAGLRALLAATANDPLKHIVLFSSSTARYGRKGQVDYAVANEVLNKTAQREAARRPECRVVAVNWGPWDGGMVTPELAKLFAAEGVGLIGIEAGAGYLLDELAASGGPAEVVILGGGAVPEPKAAPEPLKELQALELAYTLDVDVERFPFLASHVLNGKAVLPAAVILEWLSHAALHANPGLRFRGVDGLKIAKGVILEDDAPYTLRFLAAKAQTEGDSFCVDAEMRGTNAKGRDVLHASACIVLSAALPGGSETPSILAPENGALGKTGTWYEDGQLFHGPDFQGLRAVSDVSADVFAVDSADAPAPGAWCTHPLRGTWLADPLAVDVAFQAMILWCWKNYGNASLPGRVGQFRQYTRAFPKDGVRIALRVKNHTKRRAIADIEFVDPATGGLVARMMDYECTLLSTLGEAFARNALTREATR